MRVEEYILYNRKGGGSATPSDVGPLHVNDRHFWDATGKIWKMLSISYFRAYQLYLLGGASRDHLAESLSWWAGVGGNTIRVFFTHGAPGNNMFLPWLFPDYYDQLPGFFPWVHQFGLRVHATCLTGQNPGNPEWMSSGQREDHVRQIASAAGKTDPVEYVNEDWKNGLVAFSLPSFGDRANCCRSAYVWDSQKPDLEWSSLHPERKGGFDDERKVHDLVEIPFGGPRVVGEAGKVGIDLSAEEIRVMVSESVALGEGFNVHGDDDMQIACNIPTGDKLDIVLAACDEFKKDRDLIPDEASGWSYYRDEATQSLKYQLGGPAAGGGYGCQHMYCLNREGRELVLITEPSDDLRHESQPGWHIVREDVTTVYSERS